MTNKQTKLYSGYRHRFRRLLLLWIAIIYSSLPNFAQESWNIQLSQSSLSCSANEVCYQVELQNATAGSWTLGDQNYRFFFDGDLMTVTSVTSLLPAAFYSSADIDQNVKFSGLGQDAASPLDDIDDNLGFLDFSIVQTDKGNPAAAQQIGGSFIPTAEICVDVAAAAINDPSGSNCLAFYHSRPATAGDITSQYTVFSENDAPGSTVATTEGNFNDLTSADGSAACLGSSCNACATAGGDSDNDGVCDNDDCEPNNPNRPTTPGTACNDGNAQTSNDVIQADGCTCAGTVTDPCANAGGDSDNDGICDNNDCEPNNPNLPTTPGTVCDDNNSNTINDVIQADGCTCRGSQMTAAEEWNIRLTQSDVNCASSQVCYQLELQSNAGSWALGDQNYRLFFDGDLMTVTSVTSLLPNTFYGNANVDQNTKVSGQGQEAVSPLNDIDNNLGFLDFSIVQIDRSNPNAATQISTAYTPVAEICVNVASSVLNDATGSSCLAFYHSRPATAGSFTSQYTTITENEPANQTMPTMGANYDDLTSVDGTDACIGPLCDSCANRGGDSDNDGVCDNDDCQPNNPNLPTTPGTACNDGNANTTNDVIQADGCTCQGMQMADEDEWNIRLTQSAVNCTSNQVCYQLELQSNAGSWALGDQNYRLFFDGDLMTVTSVTSLLPNTFYGNANIDQNTKVSGQGQEAASPLNDIDNNLGFLDFNIIQIDRSNPNATTQITSAFTPVAEICVNVAASVLDDATGSSCLAFYHSRPATAGSFTSQYTTITENESANQTIPTTGVNYDDLTSADGTDACPGALCDACVNAGGDSDNDGVCDNDDCEPNNPNLPTTPGTACNDGNPNTINDVIQADGCTCAGSINDPCANAGGDSDNDGVCDNDDCEPNNPNLPTTPGTACNDGNAGTTNDVIQADGCTCQGTPVNADCNNITIVAGADNITVSGLDGAPVSSLQIFSSDFTVQFFQCFNNCDATEVVPLDPGTYLVFARYYDANFNIICEVEQEVTIGGNDPCANAGGDSDNDGVCDNDDCEPNNPNLPTTPGTACNDGNANTVNDVILADGCTCAGTINDPCANAGGDSDNDGVCDNDDCQPNNPNLPTTPGTACNDGNSNTINDVIQADGCTCAGTPDAGDPCSQIMITGGAGQITVGGLNTPIAIVKVFDSRWQEVAGCSTNCSPTETYNLPTGTYYVTVKLFNSSWQELCDEKEYVEVTGGGCNDRDNDGVCDEDDCAPNNPTLPTTPGRTCNDGNPNTVNDVIQVDGCTCAGTVVNDPCANRGGDSDNDGVCDADDCAPNDPNLPAVAGTSCNDGNPNTINDVIKSDGCTCAGVPTGGGGDPDCSDIQLTAANGVLSISGLTAPIVLVKVFDSGWTTVYDCVDCPSQVAIPNLSGNYVVSVKFLSSTWSPICEISENVTVPGGSGGTCDNFTNGGKIGFGNNCQNSTMLNSCPAVAPSIRNCVSPSGGSGDIEYIWLVSTTSSNPPTSTIENITIDPHWELIPSATSASYNPGVVHETSYFLRCARRENCSQYTGESNIIAIICNSSGSNITVSCPNNITVTQNTPTGTMVSWNPPTATTSCNNGGVSISQTGGLANGAMFPVGITTISYEITDGCGSTQTCSFDINVLQNNNGGGTAPTGYCSVKGTSPWTQWISNVRIGSINKTSTKEGYADFTSSSTDAIRGQQLQVRLTPGYSYTQFNMVWRVWIDWNRDGDFMDAGEMAFAQSRRGTVSGTINVPANASLGATRMRVAAQKDVAPTACESFGPGEVEDYTVQISNNLTIGGINFLTTNSTTFDVNDFKLYPNPATQRVNVEIKSFLGESITIQLFNQLGQLVLEKQIEEVNEQTAPLSVALLERGIYFVQLQAKNKTPITKKLLLSE